MSRSHFVLLAAALAFTTTACTDVDLLQPKTDEVQRGVATIEGRFCTADPATLAFPVKVWFVIDDSGSMQQNDPNQRRYLETKALAQRMEKPGTFYFGAETFAGDNNGARRVTQPDRFTDSAATFGANIDAVANPGNGGTPYLAALNFTFGELSEEVRLDPVVARRTRFVVIFLSDGAPTDSQQPAIIEAVKNVMSLKRDVGAINVNTVFLGGGNAGTQALLGAMATEGEGVFKSFPNGDALTFDGFDLSGLRRNYQQRFFSASNRSVVATADGPAPDSDRDGLSDFREAALRTDPLKADTDEDGCSDAMELRVGWSPTVPGQLNGECRCGESERLDTDGDGLSDCEERWLGTSKFSPDSDLSADRTPVGDWIPDGLDSTYLEDPGAPNDATDKDIDGVSDLQEFRTHTAVQALDTKLHEKHAYRYVKFQQDRLKPRCYDFAVENVWLEETEATADSKANENVIEVYFGQSPEDEPWKERSFHIARKKVTFDGKNAHVRFAPEDFTVVLEDLSDGTAAGRR